MRYFLDFGSLAGLGVFFRARRLQQKVCAWKLASQRCPQ
jgi:hypothetical protein